jgi:hypothetical protein
MGLYLYFQVLRKVLLGCKTGRRILKRFTYQRYRERIYNEKFSE